MWIIHRSPNWIKSKKTKISLTNKNDNKCLQYGATVALNYEKIGKNLERITKIKPFIKEIPIRKRWLEKNWNK